MKERDCSTIKYQLENFFLIPVDQIVNTIIGNIADDKNTSENKVSNSESTLDIIFESVFKGAAHYFDFIVSTANHPFFNENSGEALRTGLCRLIYLSLQNNCILNAFFEELALKSTLINISGKNKPLIERSIVDMINQCPKSKNLRGKVDSQSFNNRKRIFLNDRRQHTYTSMIIESLNFSPDKKDVFPIETLQYISPVANYLLTDDTSAKFGRSLNNPKMILNKYNNLQKNYTEMQPSYTSPIDNLIFQAEMEAIFGFSFFPSICNYIEDIHHMTISDIKGLKDLEGQLFTSIILQIANLPIFFGKDLFFRYICYSFLSSPNIDFSYFNESVKEIATMLPPSLPKIQQVNNGLILMNRFFQIISSISLPVLFSLWSVVIKELDQKELFTEPLLDIYKKYLAENAATLTTDYAYLSDKDICQLSIDYLRHDKLGSDLFDNCFLLRHIYKEATYNNCTKKTIPLFNISSYTKETMQQLIHDYCNLDSLKKFRAPAFFLTGDALTTYSPLSSLIVSLQYDPNHLGKRDYYRKNSFLIDYRKALFEYLFTKA